MYEVLLNYLAERTKLKAENVFLEQTVVGKHLTVVKLSIGSVGFSLTEHNFKQAFLNRNERDFGAFTPNNIDGRSIMELFSVDSENSQISNLQLAAANALSAYLVSKSNYSVKLNCDPFDLANIQSRHKVTLVGAFSSYIKKSKEIGCDLRVLELNENTLRPENKKFFVPAGQAQKILPDSEIIIITGSVLGNNTFENLLNYCSNAQCTILTGPSAGLLPDILFDYGVDLIGTLQVYDAASVIRTAMQGGTGYHLFQYGARKITIAKPGFAI